MTGPLQVAHSSKLAVSFLQLQNSPTGIIVKFSQRDHEADLDCASFYGLQVLAASLAVRATGANELCVDCNLSAAQQKTGEEDLPQRRFNICELSRVSGQQKLAALGGCQQA